MDQNSDHVIKDIDATLDELVDRGLVEVVPSDDSGPTITADVAAIRSRAVGAFRNDGDHDLSSDTTATGDKLDVALTKNQPDADADVLRVLAARIARAGVRGNEDPLLTLTDIRAALCSLTAAVAQLGGSTLTDKDGPEAFTTYAVTIENLRDAASGVAEMAGWF